MKDLKKKELKKGERWYERPEKEIPEKRREVV